MVQVLPRVEKQTSFGSQFGRQLGSGIGEGVSKQLDFYNKLKIEEAKQKKFANEISALQKSEGLKNALGTVEKMRSIREKGNLGRGSSILGFFGGETARDRGEYQQLGKSLISHATTIPIRNRLEFETLAEKLYDPSTTDADAEGVLNAMEKIIQDSLSASEVGLTKKEDNIEKTYSSRNSLKKVKPGTVLTKEIVEQLYKKTGGDKEKARKVAKELGYEVE